MSEPPTRSETVREALARYHRDNDMRGDAMDQDTIQMRVLGEVVDLPNPKFQRHLLARHDVHHVLTGYGTDLRGEAEMGAWELGAGPGHWFVWVNNVGALALGVLCPLRTLRAFSRGVRARSLYREAIDYEAILDMPIEELRDRLGVWH
jgi:ubiquinone biosynthesis protein Coq4